MAKWSVAKLLTQSTMFHGVGAYLRTEILAHLDGIPPWRECGILTMQRDNILLTIMSIYVTLVRDIQNWYRYDFL